AIEFIPKFKSMATRIDDAQRLFALSHPRRDRGPAHGSNRERKAVANALKLLKGFARVFRDFSDFVFGEAFDDRSALAKRRLRRRREYEADSVSPLQLAQHIEQRIEHMRRQCLHFVEDHDGSRDIMQLSAAACAAGEE